MKNGVRIRECIFRVDALYADDIADLLREFQIAPIFDSGGNINDLEFYTDTFDEHMFDEVATCIEPGSMITIEDDTMEVWNIVFENGQVIIR